MLAKISGASSALLQMTIMALQYMRGRKLRTGLTTLAVVFGVALIYGMNLALPSAYDSFKRSSSAISGQADVVINSANGESFSPDPPLATAASVKAVTAVSPVLRRQITLPAVKGDGSIGSAPAITLMGVDPESAQKVHNYLVSEGRFLEPGDTNKAVLPAAVAEIAPQLKVGSTFPLITAGGLRLYTVVGLLADRGNPTSPTILVTLPDAQSALNLPGQINAIEASVSAGADRAAVGAEVQNVLGSRFVLNKETDQLDSVGSIEIGFAIFNMMGVIALFIGAFLIFNTFRTVIIERQRDLAMLRAIGAMKGQITQMIMVESAVQGVLGSVIGLLVGFLMALGITKGMAALYAQFFPSMKLDLIISPTAWIAPFVLGVVTTLAAGYLPARAAGKISPLEGLRPTSAKVAQRTARRGLIIGIVIMVLSALMVIASPQSSAGGAILFLIGMVVAAPGLVIPFASVLSPLLSLWFAREGEIAHSNMVRQPGRAAVTASTLMIGLACLIMMAAIVNSFTIMVNRLVDRSFGGDLMILPQTIALYDSVLGADESLETKLHAISGIDTVAGLRYTPSSINGKTVQILGVDPVAYPKLSPLDFTSGTTEEAFAQLGNGRTVILNSLAATTLKLKVDDMITLDTVEGPQQYKVVGIGNDVLSFKLNSMLISQDNLKTDFHKSEDVLLLLSLQPGADKAAVQSEVTKVLADYPQFSLKATGEYRKLMLDATAGGLAFIYVLALIILIPASLGLLNTLTINVLERTREIGVLRATGANRRQVRRMVTAEALLLSLFGAAIGVLVGVAMSYGFTSAFGAVGWTLPYQFPLLGIVASVVVAILLALVSSILPARSAARLDIIRALQYE